MNLFFEPLESRCLLSSSIFTVDIYTGTNNVGRGVGLLSEDGQQVIFDTAESELVEGDVDRFRDVFLYDRDTASITAVAQADPLINEAGSRFNVQASQNLAIVGFTGRNYDEDLDAFGDKFVLVVNTRTSQVTQIDRSSFGVNGTPGEDVSIEHVSRDGQTVIFRALVTDFSNPIGDVFSARFFSYDVATGVVSSFLSEEGNLGVGVFSPNDQFYIVGKRFYTPSDDGREITIESFIFLQDVAADEEIRVDIVFEGQSLPGHVSVRGLTNDGDTLLVWTGETFGGLYHGLNRWPDAFVYNRVTGAAEPLGVLPGESFDHVSVSGPVMSDDGRYVAFWTDGLEQGRGIYRLDRQTGENLLISQGGQVFASRVLDISADGSLILFDSEGSLSIAEIGRPSVLTLPEPVDPFVPVAFTPVVVIRPADHLQGLLGRRFVTLDLGALDLLGRDGPVRLLPVVF